MYLIFVFPHFHIFRIFHMFHIFWNAFFPFFQMHFQIVCFHIYVQRKNVYAFPAYRTRTGAIFMYNLHIRSKKIAVLHVFFHGLSSTCPLKFTWSTSGKSPTFRQTLKYHVKFGSMCISHEIASWERTTFFFYIYIYPNQSLKTCFGTSPWYFHGMVPRGFWPSGRSDSQGGAWAGQT